MKVFKCIVVSLCFFTSLALFSQETNIPQPVVQAGGAVYKLDTKIDKETGFLLENGLLVTALHGFVSTDSYGALSIPDHIDSISLSQNGVPSDIKIKSLKAVSAYADIAVLEVEGDFQNYLSERKTSSLEGEFFIVGYLRSMVQYAKSRSLLKKISNIHYTMSFDLSEIEGMSGSPLLDSQGQFIGVVTSSEGNIHNSVMSDKINDVIQGRLGTHCEGNIKACIEQEIQKIQRQVDVQLDPDYKITETDRTLFHHPLNVLSLILQRQQIEPYLEKGSRLGFVRAQMNLALYYRENRNLKEVIVNKESGLITVQSKIPNETTYQKALQTNEKRSIEELKKAADQGDYQAQLNLGLLYEGQFSFLKRKSSRENKEQPFNQDPAIDQILDQAIYYLKLAADQDSATANNHLARIHYAEKEDRKRGFEYLKKAGDMGHPETLKRLSVMYMEGREGVQQDFEKAYYYALQFKRKTGISISAFVERLKGEVKQNASAQYVLGLHYVQSATAESSINPHLRSNGIEMIVTAAERGDLKARQWVETHNTMGIRAVRSCKGVIRIIKPLIDH